MNVLLVEDHPFVAEATSELLRVVYKHQVEHAATGEAAVELADRVRPDLVLIDINLPDMDGYEVARRLRERSEHDQAILVAVTGLGNSIDELRALKAGVDAWYEKPMDFDLLASINRRTA
jgi:DNA-binding response OmpR family regulator